MDSPTTILLADVRAATEARLRTAFQDLDFVTLPNGRWVRQTLRELGADAAVVGVDGDAELGFQLVRELAEAGARVLVLGHVKDPDLILQAMREGAREFVLAADDDEIVRALRAQVRPLRAGGGKVYAVIGAKGGVGATTIATNLAGALQLAGQSTCLVDLDLDRGDVLALLDLPATCAITDVVANMRRLDRELVDTMLLKHRSGLRVLAQSRPLTGNESVRPDDLASLIGFLRAQYDAVVLDGIRGFDDLAVAALDASDEILLVVIQEVPAVRDAFRALRALERRGAVERVKVVVNRFQKAVEISPEVIAESVGARIAATIANDYPAAIRGTNRGELLLEHAPRAAVTKDIHRLVAVLGHDLGPEQPAAAPSLLRRFLTPRKSHVATR